MTGSHGLARSELRPSIAAAALIPLVIIMSSYCVNAMDRTLFPLILPEVAKEYGFSLPGAGLISTVFTIGMAVAGLPSGYLMSRFAAKSVAQLGMFLFSAATIVTVFAGGFADMLFYRAVTGVGEAMQLTALLAIISDWFARYRGAAVGGLNCAFGVGAILGPLLGSLVMSAYGTWRAPMIGFGILGFVVMIVIASFVHYSANGPVRVVSPRAMTAGGAETLLNRNTLLLLVLSLIAGVSIGGFLGMYPTYLRTQLNFSPADAGTVMSLYGLGVLVSVAGGLLGDRFPMRPVLVFSFAVAAVTGWLLFNGPASFALQAGLAFAFGVVFSGAIYVNIAAGHVKAVCQNLSGRASGLFVTSFYAAFSVAGYSMGWLADRFGWAIAGDVQLCAACLVAGLLALGLQSRTLAAPAAEKW